MVEADGVGDAGDVGASCFAHGGYLVDEGDLCGEQGVGGEFDHFGGGDVHGLHGAVDVGVQVCQQLGCRRVVCADDDAVGVEEVGDGPAFGGEFRVGGVPDAVQASLVHCGADAGAGADGNGGFHHDGGQVGRLAEAVDNGPHAGQVGVAGSGGRRVDADVGDVGITDGFGGVEGIGQELLFSASSSPRPGS